MTERLQTSFDRKDNVKVMQVNVARTSAVHDIALRYGQDIKADVIILQEP
jgi:hypothetical protein